MPNPLNDILGNEIAIGTLFENLKGFKDHLFRIKNLKKSLISCSNSEEYEQFDQKYQSEKQDLQEKTQKQINNIDTIKKDLKEFSIGFLKQKKRETCKLIQSLEDKKITLLRQRNSIQEKIVHNANQKKRRVDTSPINGTTEAISKIDFLEKLIENTRMHSLGKQTKYQLMAMEAWLERAKEPFGPIMKLTQQIKILEETFAEKDQSLEAVETKLQTLRCQLSCLSNGDLILLQNMKMAKRPLVTKLNLILKETKRISELLLKT